jgi:Lysylphosphatidylglycerol synthase TM region
MESSAPPLASGGMIAARRRRLWSAIAKTALGLALLAGLLFWGQIDLKALSQLVRDPAAVVGCLTLMLLCLPLGALRWRVLLRPLGISIPFVNLLHFFSIGVLANMFLLGSAGGDAVRGLHAWAGDWPRRRPDCSVGSCGSPVHNVRPPCHLLDVQRVPLASHAARSRAHGARDVDGHCGSRVHHRRQRAFFLPPVS